MKNLKPVNFIEKIRKSNHVVVIGALAFDFWDDLSNAVWFKERIKKGEIKFEVFCEASYVRNSQALVSELSEVNHDKTARYGEYSSKIDEVYELREQLKGYGCATIDPVEDQIKKYVNDKAKEYEEELWSKAEAKIYYDRYGNKIKTYDPEVIESIREQVENYKQQLKKEKEQDNSYKYCFILRTCYTVFTVPAIKFVKGNDVEYFYSLSLTRFINIHTFDQTSDSCPCLWHQEIKDYFAYFESKKGGIKYSTEETSRKDKLEVIQTYAISGDDGREPLHLLPRKSFLETPQQKKLVVWGFIFTQDGRMLIHQRGKNASDNQGLWDKSVGGHVAPNDIDTAKALAREMAEELYTQEKAEQGGHGESDFVKINENKMIFLGEWQENPEKRINVKEIISSKRDEYYYFRFDYGFSKKSHLSPRLLPSGEKQDVDAFVDVFVGIVSDKFNIEKLSHNSKYMLKTPKEILTMINDKKYISPDGKEEEFKVSPDIHEMLREGLWDKLIGFSDYLKKNL